MGKEKTKETAIKVLLAAVVAAGGALIKALGDKE